jgi:alpha-beta hydrolase superfamily lysophospholipase
MLLVAGCSNGGTATDGGADGGGADLMQPAGPQIEVACTDTIDSIYADPGTVPTGKGSIVKCAKDKDIPVKDLNALLVKDGFTARPVVNGVHTYRVLYVTERGTVPPTPGTSSALVVLPDTPRAAKLPVLVASHATRGQCADCTPSKETYIADGLNEDYERQIYGFAGVGFAVIIPDLAGYANFGAASNPLSAFGSADDTGKSTLDGARALRKLIPSVLSDKVVITGHSQGGNSALAAAALYDTYGADGTLSAMVLYAPLWITQRSWGAIVGLPSAFPFMGNEGPNAISIWYHYIHGELIDGPGHGGDVFLASKRAAIKSFAETEGWYAGTPPWALLYTLGSSAADIYDPTFMAAIGDYAPGVNATDCPTDSNGPLCQKWKARYLADRPHLSATTAQVPTLLLWGEQDQTITPPRITCAIDRLKSDGVNLTLCIDPGSDHESLLGVKADYASDWLAAKVLGETAPPDCALHSESDIMMNGAAATCATVPPND